MSTRAIHSGTVNPVGLLAGLLAIGLVSSASALAQETVIPPTPAPAATSMPAMPARGSTMDAVKTKFGAPSQEVPAVGTPPITRWEYPGYVVFFENDRVLHTVVLRS